MELVTMNKVMAFHGDLATPKMLQEDIGSLGKLDDLMYWSTAMGVRAAAKQLKTLYAEYGPVALVGYSNGGELIADVSVEHPDKIACAVVYESRLGRFGSVGGTFPVCLIWNDQGRFSRKAAKNATKAWKHHNRSILELTGQGEHIRVDDTLRPRFRHGWDQSLNKEIETFICSHLLFGG